MNVIPYNTRDYENKCNWTLGENKPNSNPIKPNFRKAQMNVNSLITKDYRKNDDFAVRKNKPNSKPISSKAKMNANAFSQKDCENETAFRPKKTNPNKPNFKPDDGFSARLGCCDVPLIYNYLLPTIARSQLLLMQHAISNTIYQLCLKIFP